MCNRKCKCYRKCNRKCNIPSSILNKKGSVEEGESFSEVLRNWFVVEQPDNLRILIHNTILREMGSLYDLLT